MSTAPAQPEQPLRRLSTDEITAELAPLAAVVDRTLRTVPAQLGDTTDLTAALALAVAAHLGPLVGDVPEQLAARDAEIQRLRAELAETEATRDRYAASLAAALPSTDERLRSNAEANHAIAASLRAKADTVLALHRPVQRGAMTICDACSPKRGNGPTRYVLVDYPCSTVDALTAAPRPTT